MKKTISFLLAISLVLFFSSYADAQGKGKGKAKVKAAPAAKHKPAPVAKAKKKGPPPWAPAHGYHKRHVYFPDHHCYYDNTNGVYISLVGGHWVVNASIPVALKGIDLKVAVKMEIDFTGDNPQVNFNSHKMKHPGKSKVKPNIHKH